MLGSGTLHHYRVRDGQVLRCSIGQPPAGADDRLYLVTLSGIDEFRLLYDALSGMSFYDLCPSAIRELQYPESGEFLRRDGSNLAGVLSHLEATSPATKARIEEYLSRVVPGVAGIRVCTLGLKQTIEFLQEVPDADQFSHFHTTSMSDGTLRAVAVLVALFQSNARTHPWVVGIENPEAALHPPAAGILTDALSDASESAQVLVTSHSPDLLDNETILAESILAVVAEQGETRIGPLDEADRSVLRDHLFTAGELLRMDQLRPDPELSHPRQLDLFGPAACSLSPRS